MDDILGMFVGILLFAGVIVFGLTAQIQVVNESRVDSIITTELELISTNGEISTDTYETLKMKLATYGEFNIQLRLDIKQAGEIILYDKIFSEKNILNRKLKVGDRVHFLIKKLNSDKLERMANSNLFFEKNKDYNFKNYRYYTVPIVKDGE